MEVQLHTANEDLLLNNIWLILKILSKIGHQLISIFNHVHILPNDPHN